MKKTTRTTILVGGKLLVADSTSMAVGTGTHVRQVEFLFPEFNEEPIINATVYSKTSPGNVFGIWDVKSGMSKGGVLVAISATGSPVDYEYFCDIIAIGTVAVRKKKSEKKNAKKKKRKAGPAP